MKIGEQIIKQGDFLAYSLGDVHLNPEYYPEPYKYDPGRRLRPDPSLTPPTRSSVGEPAGTLVRE